MAIMRCLSPGVMWNDSPGCSIRFSSVAASPVCSSRLPESRWIVSSFDRWYCRLSACPLRTCRILPTYRSVCAQISSYPQGFSTRTGLCSGIR